MVLQALTTLLRVHVSVQLWGCCPVISTYNTLSHVTLGFGLGLGSFGDKLFKVQRLLSI